MMNINCFSVLLVINQFLSFISDFFINFVSRIRLSTYIYLLILLIILLIIIIVRIALIKPLKGDNYKQKPKGIVNVAEFFVDYVDNFTTGTGSKRMAYVAPWIGIVMITLPLNFLTGLWCSFLALDITTTSMVSITLTFSIITFSYIQIHAIKGNGVKEWFKGKFLAPFAIFLPINLITFWVPALSLALRIFGNSVSGGIILGIVRWATEPLSALFGTNVNFMAMIITPPLHLYFDLFGAFIQTVVFLMLTIIFIDMEWE